MPPSTVFSYWRRDHRRSTAPPASLSANSPLPTAESPLSPPQLPEIPDTQALSSVLDTSSSYDAPPWLDPPLEPDAAKLNFTSSTAPLSSSVSLAVASPSVEKDHRPHSSPDDLLPESSFTAQPNDSQLSMTGFRDQDGESNSKPTSPFRLSFGKGLRNLQTPVSDNARKSPTAGPGTSNLRLKTSPEEPLAEKPVVTQKETKQDGVVTRRVPEREVSAENVHHKSGKAMLHLLNPMSLLARRRSSQMGSSRVEDAKMSAPNLIPAIPDDYDPRIRGNIVHDFSAPRPRRNVSGNSGNAEGNSQQGQDASAQHHPANRWSENSKQQGDHSPMFKEHFEDDRNTLQVENKGYLQSTLLTNPTQAGYEKSIPVFARRFPSTAPEHTEAGDDFENLPAELPGDVPMPIELPAEVPPQYTTSPPKTSPPTSQKDHDIIPKVHPAGLPKHLKSNASSRFSFDMGGVESSVQEKLLEEKHKAKEAARKLEDGYFDDFDEDFDNDMLDDMDDMEEQIPELNADYDENEFEPPVQRATNNEFKSWAAPGLSPVVASPITPAPPAENRLSSSSSGQLVTSGTQWSLSSEESDETVEPEEDLTVEPLKPQHTPGDAQSVPQAPQQGPSTNTQVLEDADDDLYFDDGEFGDLNADDQDGGFDESIFDDETSHLYERKPVNKAPAQEAQAIDPIYEGVEKDMLLEENANQGLKHMPSVASEYQIGAVKRGPLGEPIPNMGPARAHGGVLTEQNLEVLHNALAFAASEAATQSRFGRTASTSERSQAQECLSQTSHTSESQPGLVSDDSRLSQIADAMAFDDVFDDHIYDDDAYFDDPIVAAANAEALENDDEGFYGQEFGFYANAHGSNTGEMTNGGYFGPRGVEGITRSFSSGGKFQEPSLTPITERSEWSTRNSVISVKANGTHSNPSLASPGLAQLVDMGNLDDEMTLSALMKLRRGAWGGSNGSLRSSAGSPPPHTLTSSHRGSFAAPSETASPSEGRPPIEDSLASLSYYEHSHTVSQLRDSELGQTADLPHNGINGPVHAEGHEELPNTGNHPLNVV